MKSVMISIQPQWCDLILSGKKTLEVRKTRPKLETPFKVYIYCTKASKGWFKFSSPPLRLDGYIIGEFICDSIRRFDVPYPAYQNKLDPKILEESCVRYYALHRYAYHDDLYGWHISDLKIYDKPKPLSEFRVPCREYAKDNPRCGNCDYYYFESNESIGFYDECACDGMKHMTRPPQSWCYVEAPEVEG